VANNVSRVLKTQIISDPVRVVRKHKQFDVTPGSIYDFIYATSVVI
jgi:hypothetical protein